MNKICTFFSCVLLMVNQKIYSQTESQIQQAKSVIKSSALSKSQVIEAAKSRGFSDKQINDVIEKESRKSKNQLDINLEDSMIKFEEKNIDSKEKYENFTVDNEEAEKSIETKGDIDTEKLEYFGYNVFKRDPSIFQSSTIGAVDPDYLIGPGDEIIVTLWGETEFRQALKVNREGFIFISEIGQVFVNGLNLKLLESKLFRVLSQSYASLSSQGSRATTFLDVSLGNLRPLRIQVLGQVEQPGGYTVSTSATLFSALYYFNGPTTLGSLRDIRLIRGNKEIASVDYYDFLLSGKKPKDEKLKLDDVIFIPKRLKTVSIQGEVNQPGIYEVKPEETFNDLLLMCGGLKITAYTNRVQIDRVISFDERLHQGADRAYIDIDLDKIINKKEVFELKDGDKIVINSILDSRPNIIYLNGAVTRPGRYELLDSLRLNDLITRAEGLLGNAYKERADIIRLKEDLSEEIIKISLTKAMEGDVLHNLNLKKLDKIIIYNKSEIMSENFVSIDGFTQRPGQYPLFKNMKIADLIFLAGGFSDSLHVKSAYLERADLIRDDQDGINKIIYSFNLGEILNNPDSNENLELKPDDMVRLYSKDIFEIKKTVSISGLIRSRGNFDYKLGMNLKDLILEAGGLSNDIYAYKVEIVSLIQNNYKQLAKSIEVQINSNYDIIEKSESSISSINDIKLKPYDFVSVRRIPDFDMIKKVNISGAIKYPGDYALINIDEKLSNLIKRAGGIRENAYPIASTFLRGGNKINLDVKRLMNNPSSKHDIVLQNGDQIIINKKPDLISIVGQVNVPGFYKFTKGLKIDDVIKQAGGLTKDANKDEIYITYPSGKSFKYSFFSNKKVIDGSKIVVNAKPEEEPFDKTEFLTEMTSIIANMAQAISIILLVRN